MDVANEFIYLFIIYYL